MRTLLLLALLALAAPGALSQTIAEAPNFGTFTLGAGFMPDPQTAEVLAGGPNPVAI